MIELPQLFNRRNIDLLPNIIGVYLFRDKQKSIIYIGKTKNLKVRIKSYYQKIIKLKSGTTDFPLVLRNLLLNLSYFEIIPMKTELEALLSENDMIKEYLPEYNIKQRDFPEYSFIEISDKPYPYLKILAQPGKKLSWFGPYKDKFFASDLINIIADVLKIRTCQDNNPGNRCLRFDLGKCSAPCRDKISQTEYAKLIESAKKFLSGNSKRIVNILDHQLNQAEKTNDFKRQKFIQSNIQFVQKFSRLQRFLNRFYENYFILPEFSLSPTRYLVFKQDQWTTTTKLLDNNLKLSLPYINDKNYNISSIYDQAKIVYRYLSSSPKNCGFFYKPT